MFKIQFFVGLPHAWPRQQIAEATSMYDDANKALAEAEQKAQFISTLLQQQITGRPAEFQAPVEDDADYTDGHLSDAARLRLTQEAQLALWGPHPLPSRDVKAHLPAPVLEIRMTSDDGQLVLMDIAPAPIRTNGHHEHRPSGDYRATVTMPYGEYEVELGVLDFAATTAVRALNMAVERARVLIDTLKKEPKLKLLSFNALRISVERINTQISFVKEEPDFDWRHMEFPVPHF